MHTVSEDGKTCRRSTLELVLLTLRNKAMEGNVSEIAACEKILAKYNPPKIRGGGYLVAPAGMTEKEAIEEAREADAKREMEEAANLAKNSQQEE